MTEEKREGGGLGGQTRVSECAGEGEEKPSGVGEHNGGSDGKEKICTSGHRTSGHSNELVGHMNNCAL